MSSFLSIFLAGDFIFSKIMALLLGAIGVQFVINGLTHLDG